MRELVLKGGLAALLIWLPTLASGAELDGLYHSLLIGDTAAAGRFVVVRYEAAGADFAQDLELREQPFDRIVDYYDTMTEEVWVSSMPRPDEVDVYWSNWSNVLTGGQWRADTFFADAAEAALMANFNQFLITAHEYGHVLVYRYDPGYEWRWTSEINCREFAADRIADSLLNDLAAQDARFARLNTRYLELIAELNGLVPQALRHGPVTLDQLKADCRIMHVDQGSETAMTAYASAFFVRHLVMLCGDLPTLPELFEAQLFSRWRAAQPPPLGRYGAVTTVARYPPGTFDPPGTGLAYDARLVAFDPDGAVYAVDIGLGDGDRPLLRVGFGPAGGAIAEVFPTGPLPGLDLEGRRLFPNRAVVLGPDRFLIIAGGYGFFPQRHSVLLDFRRQEGVWSLRYRDFDDQLTTEASVAAGPHGQLSILLYRDTLTRLELDPSTLETVAEVAFEGPYGASAAIDAAGNILFAGDYQIVAIDAQGRTLAAVGNRLRGYRDDSRALDAEILMTSPTIATTADGGLVFTDRDPLTNQMLVRRAAPAP